ncbi:MAG: tetratricopeptide repeat protein [Candidatus Zixiibacteriota bacterium]|nr:MAG: tetratricopeptide repeat protein [candidate division Zixibacteria bacterium]
METYRLSSRLVENDREYLIQTSNDVALGSVSSEVFINGALADSVKVPHPEQMRAEEVLTFVESAHDETKKEIESLLKAYREAIESANGDMMYHLALSFFYKRFYAEARTLLNTAVGINPDYHEAYNVLGQAELSLGHPKEAVAAAQTAVNKRPEYADYRNNLGEALLASRALKLAAKEFDKAIEINLYYSDAYFNYGLAMILEALKEDSGPVKPNLVSKAQEYFTKAVLTYPDYKTAGYARGLESLQSGDLRPAFSTLAKVREEKKFQHGRRYSQYHMRFALYPQWVTEKALVDRISFLQEEIAKNPGYVDLHIELSRCYLEQAQVIWRKAIDSYRKTLDINPSLGELAANVDRAEDAYEVIVQTIQKVSERG